MAMLEMNQLLKVVVERDASDLHLACGKPPVMRMGGVLENLSSSNLVPDDTERLMREITPPRCQQQLQEVGSTDFGYAFSDIARFRVAVLRSRGSIGMVLRLIPSRIFAFDDLGLDRTVIIPLLHAPRGLVLVVGPTGSGKTTTLATLMDYINTNRYTHIITVEDPIEYMHPHKKSIVTHREIHVDTPSFSYALRGALRQDPDIILVGEMRDLETMEAAISAAETGHLVFGTLHTISAAQTVDRVVDAFPMNQQEQVRAQLSVSLKAVIAQTLLPKASGKGRIASYEIMINTPAIQNLIREKKTYRITSIIQTSSKLGMMTMDDCLLRLYNEGKITGEIAIERAHDPNVMRNNIMIAKGDESEE